jgi:predicted membrane protein
MNIRKKLTTQDVALIICFTALYVVLSFLSISPIIGLPGKTITAAAIIAPIMGIILGPYVGFLSTFSGGIIGFFFGSFSQPSFASGIVASLCAGLLFVGKRSLCAITYLSLLLAFGFFPIFGPVWLFPYLIWFQIVGFLLLLSPLQSLAIKNLNSDKNTKVLYAFFITSLTSTLAGQIAGSLVFTILVSSMNSLKANWEFITFLYPVERTIIAVSAAFIGTSLYKVLKSSNLKSFLNHTNAQEKRS